MDWWGTSKSKAKPVKLVRPVKSYTKKTVAKIPKQRLSWPQAQVRYPRLNPFGDSDRDGKLNMFDCRPFNRMQHGRMLKTIPEEYNKARGAWPAQRTVIESGRKLRAAGFPTEVANRVKSWWPHRVKQVIAGERSFPGLSHEQIQGLHKVQRQTKSNPQAVKAYFDKIRKDTEGYKEYDAYQKAYAKTPKAMETRRKYAAKRYHEDPEYREYLRRHKSTLEYKEYHKKYMKEYHKRHERKAEDSGEPSEHEGHEAGKASEDIV